MVIRDSTSRRLCETHTLHVPLAYSELVLAMGGAIGSVQQLFSAISITVPSARVISGRDLRVRVSRRLLDLEFAEPIRGWRNVWGHG